MTETTDKQSGKSFLVWLLTIVLLAALAAAGYLLHLNSAMEDRITQTYKERDLLEKREQELQQEVSNLKNVETKTKEELSTTREKLLRLQRQIREQELGKEVQPPDVKIVPLNLVPHTRASGRMQLLSISPEIDYVAFTLQLEGPDFKEYQVALKAQDQEKILWQSGNLKPVGKTIQFGMPGKIVLEEQNYIFELSGISEDKTTQVISGFPFRVVME
jgi:hypothetical protein